MINLLPPAVKDEILYARRNTALRRWIVACTLAVAGVGVIVLAGLFYLQKSINNYDSQLVEARQSLKAQKVDETQKQIEDISSSTKLAVQVLSREILFSKLIRQIGSALPSNTALNSLEIDQLEGGIQLSASAADFNSATQIQVNLQDPKNGVFEKSDINSIACADKPPENSLYPCDVSVRALFGKNNSYYFIAPNQTGAATQEGAAQ